MCLVVVFVCSLSTDMALYKSKKSWVKYLIVLWAFLECLLFAGTLYGWSSLVFVFKEEGIFADLCQLQPGTNDTGNTTYITQGFPQTESEITEKHVTSSEFTNGTDVLLPTRTKESGRHAQCKKQDGMLSLCFTISASVFCISCVVMGHVNYKLGTRNTRYIAYAIFVTGALCLAFTSRSVPWLMFPGLSLIGIGGLPVFVTNNQVAYLFKGSSSTVVGLMCGGYDMSAAVYLAIKLAHEGGFTRRNMFFVLIGAHLMTLVSTQKLLPKWFIRPAPAVAHDTAEKPAGQALLNEGESHTVHRRPSIADPQPLVSYLRQPLFVTHNVWLCLLQLRFYYYIGNLNTYLNRILNGDTRKVSYFTDVCFYTMMGGLFTSFLVGMIYDGQKAIFRGGTTKLISSLFSGGTTKLISSLFSGGTTKLYRSLMPALLPLSLASVSALLLSVLVLIHSEATLYPSFIIMTLYRSFTYVMAAAFISAIFPSQYFAVLYGITMIAAGVFSLLQYALFSWAETFQKAPFQVDIFLLCISVLTLGHPVYMFYCGCWEERSTKNPDHRTSV